MHNHRGVQGFSLFTLVVMVSFLATIAAASVSCVTKEGNVTKGGKSKGDDAENETLQLAVDSWKSTIGKQEGPLLPILQCGEVGPCVGGEVDLSKSCISIVDANGQITTSLCNSYLDIAALAEQGFVRNAASVKSANTSLNTTAKNQRSGSYG